MNATSKNLNYRAKHATFCDVRVKPRFSAMTQHMAIESGAGFDSMDFDLNKSTNQSSKMCQAHNHNHQIIRNRCLWHSYMLMYRILPACLKVLSCPLETRTPCQQRSAKSTLFQPQNQIGYHSVTSKISNVERLEFLRSRHKCRRLSLTKTAWICHRIPCVRELAQPLHLRAMSSFPPHQCPKCKLKTGERQARNL